MAIGSSMRESMPEVVGIGSFITRMALGTYGREVTSGLGLRWKTCASSKIIWGVNGAI